MGATCNDPWRWSVGNNKGIEGLRQASNKLLPPRLGVLSQYFDVASVLGSALR